MARKAKAWTTRRESDHQWEPFDVPLPRELCIDVLVEKAERELVDQARQLTRALLYPHSSRAEN